RVLGGDEAHLTAHAHLDDASRLQQAREPRVELARLASQRQLVPAQIAEAEQQIVHAVGVFDEPPAQPLEPRLHLEDRVAIEQLAQVGLAEQLAQLRVVEREQPALLLGERRVALVHEARDVVEEQRRRERRGRARADAADEHAPLLHVAQELDQARQIEDVAQALAVGLEEDRKLGIARGDGQQLRALSALRPERRALAGPPPRQEQRASGVLAKARGKEARAGELVDDDAL